MSRSRQSVLVRASAFDARKIDWPGIGAGWPQLVFPAHGAPTIIVRDRQWVVPRGQGLWLGARVRHRIRSAATVGIRAVYFQPGTAGLPRRSPCLIRISPLLREVLRRVLELTTLKGDLPAHRRLLAVLIDELAELRRPSLADQTPLDPRAARAAALIRSQPHRVVTIAEAAAAASTSARTLARLFREETGLGVGAWARGARLSHAIQLLAEGRSVGEAGFGAGYGSSSAFIAAFRRVHRVTPARYFTTEHPIVADGAPVSLPRSTRRTTRPGRSHPNPDRR